MATKITILALSLFLSSCWIVGYPSPVSLEGTSTTCSVETDCIGIAANDPCAVCGDVVAISNDEVGKAKQKEVDEQRAMWCQGGVDCLQTMATSCVDGTCVRVPLNGQYSALPNR
jgi:hypothetical protein